MRSEAMERIVGTTHRRDPDDFRWLSARELRGRASPFLRRQAANNTGATRLVTDIALVALCTACCNVDRGGGGAPQMMEAAPRHPTNTKPGLAFATGGLAH